MVEAVRTRRAFSALSSSRTRGRSGPVWVVRAAGADDGIHVAYAVGRAVGGAVVRNRVRRRLRAVVTDLERRRELPSGLYLVGVTPDAATVAFDSLADHVEHAVAAVR